MRGCREARGKGYRPAPRKERGSRTSDDSPPVPQVELYAALQAARAELPRDPEAFRLWLHRARKQGLVTSRKLAE